jgi:hypothetical protein
MMPVHLVQHGAIFSVSHTESISAPARKAIESKQFDNAFLSATFFVPLKTGPERAKGPDPSVSDHASFPGFETNRGARP